MNIYEIYYSTDWRDKIGKRTHDHMILTFIVKAKSEGDAVEKLANKRPDLNSEKFSLEEITDDVYLASNESYDE